MATIPMLGDQLFNGREGIVRDIVAGVLAEEPLSYSLVGSKMVGKSRLLQYLSSEEGPLLGDALASWRPEPFQAGGSVFVVRIDCSLSEALPDFVGYLFAQVAAAMARESPPLLVKTPDGSRPQRLMSLLRALGDSGYRPVLLLDSFDRIFAALPMDTVNELRPLTLHAAVVVATEQPLIDLDTDRASSPLFNMMTQLFIGLLEPDAARRWMEEYVHSYPGIYPCLDELLVLTGTHPFLMRRMGDILQEVGRMLPGGAEGVGPSHLALLRLRLAEHARPLFDMLWRRLQAPPPMVQRAVVLVLVRRLVGGLLPLAQLSHEESSAVNWMYNMALLSYCAPAPQSHGADAGAGYSFFSPLLTEFLRERLSEAPAAPAAAGVPPQPAHAAALARAGGAAMDAPAGAKSAAPPTPSDIEPEFLARLTKIEAAMLGYFQSHSNQIITPEQLLRDVWHRPNATARRVQEAIRRLRMVLEAANPAIGTIENDRGRGYRFVPAPRN